MYFFCFNFPAFASYHEGQNYGENEVVSTVDLFVFWMWGS